MSNRGCPDWFKVHKILLAAAKAAGETATGEAVIAALTYFNDRQPQSVSDRAIVIFALLKDWVDESLSDYAARVEDGKRGANMKGKSSHAPLSPPKASLTEETGRKKKKTREREERGAPTRQELEDYMRRQRYSFSVEKFMNYGYEWDKVNWREKADWWQQNEPHNRKTTKNANEGIIQSPSYSEDIEGWIVDN